MRYSELNRGHIGAVWEAVHSQTVTLYMPGRDARLELDWATYVDPKEMQCASPTIQLHSDRL